MRCDLIDPGGDGAAPYYEGVLHFVPLNLLLSLLPLLFLLFLLLHRALDYTEGEFVLPPP